MGEVGIKYKYFDEKIFFIYYLFQNMFIIDGVEDIDNWVYILIIVYYR